MQHNFMPAVFQIKLVKDSIKKITMYVNFSFYCKILFHAKRVEDTL